MNYETQPKATNTPGTIIIIVACWFLFTGLFYNIIPNIDTAFYSRPGVMSLIKLLSLIWSAVPITLAFAIENRKQRTIVIILGCLHFITFILGEVLSYLYKPTYVDFEF